MSSISFYKTYDPNKENILFLHGFLESHTTWVPFLSNIYSEYNCLLYDFPGHGNNLEFPLDLISFETICSEIVKILQDLNIHSTHLVCHSMGGYFGCFLKENYPNTFNKIVISNSILEPDSETQLNRRKRMIRIIKTNQPLLCKLSFTDLDNNLKSQKEAICLTCNREHLIELQNTLSKRPSFKHLYLKYTNDFFFIFGEKDIHIPWENTKIYTKKRQYTLSNEGHTLPLNSIQKWVNLVLNALK